MLNGGEHFGESHTVNVRLLIPLLNFRFLFVDGFAKLRKFTINLLLASSYLCLSVRPSVRPNSWNNLRFKVCKSVHHRTIQINYQPDGRIFQFIILMFIYSSTCCGRSPAHHQELNDCSGSLWFCLRIVTTVVLCSWSGRPASGATNKPTTAENTPTSTFIRKPEAVTAVWRAPDDGHGNARNMLSSVCTTKQ